MDYNAPSFSSDPDADFVGKSGSTVGSAIPPNVPTLTQREIVNAEKCAGVAPANSDRTQLAQSIGRGLWVGTLGANPNALVGSLGAGVSPSKPGILQTLNPWTKLRGIALQTNTQAAVTVTISGVGTSGGVVTGPLLRRGGGALSAGDVPTLFPFEFQPDGKGNFWMVGAVASESGVPSPIATAQAAGSPFNFKFISSTTRYNASAQGAGIQITVLSGLGYTKKSATSNLVVVPQFGCYSPVAPGQGSGAAGARLLASNGTYLDFGLNSSSNSSSGAAVGSGGNSPTLVLPGIPAGALTLALSLARGDNYAWNTIFNPYPSDFSTTGATPSSFFFAYEYEPTA